MPTLTTHALASLVREVVRAAKTLCDGTAHHADTGTIDVDPEDWHALADTVTALETSLRTVSPFADAGHAATIIMDALPCVHGQVPAAACAQHLGRGCPGYPQLQPESR